MTASLSIPVSILAYEVLLLPQQIDLCVFDLVAFTEEAAKDTLIGRAHRLGLRTIGEPKVHTVEEPYIEGSSLIVTRVTATLQTEVRRERADDTLA